MVKEFNKNTILKRIKYYENLLKRTNNPEKAKMIKEAILSLQTIQNETYGKAKCNSTTLNMKKIEMDDKAFLSLHNGFMPYIHKVYEEIIKGIKSPLHLRDVQSINLDNNKIITVTQEFYENIGDIFAQKIEELYDYDNIHISFYNLGNQDKTAAMTYKVKNFDEVFIRLGTEKSIEDYLSSFHEHSHAISSIINPEHIESDFKKCLSEVDSLFFELVGLEYFKQNGWTKADIKAVSIKFLDFVINGIKFIVGKDMIYKRDSINKYHSQEEITKHYIEALGYDKKSASNMAVTRIRDYIAYVVSSLVAIELFFQYRVDADMALENLKNIIEINRFDSNDYIAELQSMGIVLGEHFLQFYNEVINNKPNKNRNSFNKK